MSEPANKRPNEDPQIQPDPVQAEQTPPIKDSSTAESNGWVVSPEYSGPDRRSTDDGRRDTSRSGHARRAIDKAQVLLEAEELAEEMAREGDTGLERRRGPGRRRSDFTKAAEEGEMTKEQFLFVMAIEAFKQANNKMFPTWTDVLEVLRLLGYRKTCNSELNLRNAEDWTEQATASSNVREGATHLLREKHAEDERQAA